jgi:hypothetical protein
MLVYLVSPALVFLTTWIRPAIGFPAAFIVAAGLIRLVRSPEMFTPRPPLSRKIFWLVLALALVWTLSGGVGGFFPQSTDYIKHNLLFHDLIRQSWPVTYVSPGGGTKYLCYGAGYYLVPALGGRFLGENLLPLLALAWTFAGVALFFHWAATLGSSPLKTLAMVLGFAATGVLWLLFKRYGIPGLISADGLQAQLLKLGLFFSYYDSFTRFQYQPQHALTGWLGAAVIYDLLWVKRKPRGAFFVWAACLLWSPLSCLGLLLVPLAALRRVRWLDYFEPVNVVAGGVLLVILGMYYQGHVPLAGRGPIWKFAGGTQWPWFYALFLAFELSPILMVFLVDRKYRVLGDLRPLFLCSLWCLILLPLYKFGFYSDLRFQASGPALLFAALGAALCWQNAAFSLKRPMFILLAATVLIGAVYPLLRPWQNLMTNTQTIPYANIVQDSGFKNLSEMRDPLFDLAPQYLGRTNSAAVRWLLR